MRDLRSILFGAALATVLAACVAAPGTTDTPSAASSGAPASEASAITPAASPSITGVGDDCSAMDASADYCRRLGNWMRRHHHLSADTPLRIEEIPFVCHDESGKQTLCNLGGSPPRTMRATTPDGSSFELELPCAGIPSSAICYEQPPLYAGGVPYWDVPCSGDGPSDCATPPAIDPDAQKESKALLIDKLDHPVGAVGHHEDEIGTAVLPNGILSKARIDLAEADQVQRGFIIDPMSVLLQVESTDPTRPPFMNIYERGRFPGVETVKVVLVYDVVENPTDAVLHFLNIEVR